MKLWIDDIRDAPDDTWVECRKVQNAISLISMFGQTLTEVSIDHDIENRPDDETFQPVAHFLGMNDSLNSYRAKHEGITAIITKITVHSDNPVGAKQIQDILRLYGITAEWIPFTSHKDFKEKYGL